MVESSEGESQRQMKKKKKRIGGAKEIKLIWANNRRKCQSCVIKSSLGTNHKVYPKERISIIFLQDMPFSKPL